MKVAVASDPGKVRQHNEDSCGTKDNIFIVADGMGGHQAGEIASTLAVNKILFHYNTGMSMEEIKNLLRETNAEILQMARQDTQYHGMGTTLSILILKDGIYNILHVGDSRIYLLEREGLVQLTSDHSITGELIRTGNITEEEAKQHPQRNVLTRALGTEEDIEIETREGTFEKGAIFLLCTDGLCGYVTEEEMTKVLTMEATLQGKADKLIQAANVKGGHDNITVMLVEA